MKSSSVTKPEKLRVFILGASGKVGSILVQRCVARGHKVTAQTRDARKVVAGFNLDIAVGAPADKAFLEQNITGHDAVVICLGVDHTGRTTLFSDVTRELVDVMQAAGVNRLVVITGIGAGDTKGHGGWFYNYLIYPFITRHQYADKDIQEAIIGQSSLDWTIIRPAPFSSRTTKKPLHILTRTPRNVQLRFITVEEVAAFILDSLENRTFVRQMPFIGHN
ncbi:NAD(P)-dependent oxidoreductase [Pseudochrobactrum sp. XF203]|uniref:NAD(P)-dependent oxidoreductase n=1 Tax=Pseudochrobactrum sp. XF203 TaxID=2879116 RepID=UPI001CE2D39E|nr:NAD(P)H-binding protein [Pseudochrobactrum sp. XF203]UCA47457.1 NAD(P)H-binding protein [Pseudochrobactrum sp. XF203]